MSVNFELVYKLRKQNTNSRNNLRIQYENEARRKADAEHEKYLSAIKAAIGHDRFEVTNVSCMAEGIIGHVYAWEGAEPGNGIGRKKCIYCGCDDFDF